MLQGSTIHTLSLREDLSRVVVEKVKVADAKVPEPTSEVRFVGQALLLHGLHIS